MSGSSDMLDSLQVHCSEQIKNLSFDEQVKQCIDAIQAPAPLPYDFDDYAKMFCQWEYHWIESINGFPPEVQKEARRRIDAYWDQKYQNLVKEELRQKEKFEKDVADCLTIINWPVPEYAQTSRENYDKWIDQKQTALEQFTEQVITTACQKIEAMKK